MKVILCLMSSVILIASAGCVFSGHRGDREYRPHEEDRGHPEHGVDMTPERLESLQPVA
ncbi:MAG: hypothetical protein ACLQVX_19315 [Limisphaerales bacterium]